MNFLTLAVDFYILRGYISGMELTVQHLMELEAWALMNKINPCECSVCKKELYLFSEDGKVYGENELPEGGIVTCIECANRRI